MANDIIHEIQDLTYLKWAHARSSSGTAGSFLKSESTLGERKIYYKLSNFDSVRGVVGHECINEIIVDRLLTLLGIHHLHYQLIHAKIEVDGNQFTTYLCASEDFKKRGENKIALDDFYRTHCEKGESHYDFCVRQGWQETIHQMIAVDYLILNRDRHGANIEVLRNARAHTLRIAPLFDHGLSFLYSCQSDAEAKKFDVLEDKRCQNFIGNTSCFENLSLLKGKEKPFHFQPDASARDFLLDGLDGAISDVFLHQIWNMISERTKVYESI